MTAVPTIAGTASLDSVLTATPGTWGPDAVDLSYQWLRDGAPIPGATAATYAVAEPDLLHNLSVAVTGTKQFFTTATTTSTTVAVAATPARLSKPQVSGILGVGNTLTAAAKVYPATATLSYQWFHDGKPIAKATKATYKLVKRDLGKKLAVQITANRLGYATVSAKSTPTSAIKLGFKHPGKVTISGKAKVGKKLKASPGKWAKSVHFAYQWRADGATIKKATHATYKVASSLAGKRITVTVKASKPKYATTPETSKATKPVKK